MTHAPSSPQVTSIKNWKFNFLYQRRFCISSVSAFYNSAVTSSACFPYRHPYFLTGVLSEKWEARLLLSHLGPRRGSSRTRWPAPSGHRSELHRILLEKEACVLSSLSPAHCCSPLQCLLLIAALTSFTSHILSIRVSDFPEGTVMQQADQPNTQLAIRNVIGWGHFPLALDVS